MRRPEEVSVTRGRGSVLLALAIAACGRATTQGAGGSSGDGGVRERQLSELYILEMSGIPPEDTVVTFRSGQARTIVLRHGPPDNTVFVELTFPDSVFRGSPFPDSVTATIKPRPGVYGLELGLTATPRRGATIRFKYPVHFLAPVAALRKHGSAVRFERTLSVARRIEGERFALLPSDRPASDNLRSALPGPGTYLVAGVR